MVMPPAWFGELCINLLSFQDDSAGGATCPYQLSCWSPQNLTPFCIPSAGIAVALRQAMTPEFKAYQQQVVANCKALSAALMELGYDIVTGEDRSRRQVGADPHVWPGVRAR